MVYKYRAFRKVLRDYKHLYQENQMTYLNGIKSNGIDSSLASMPVDFFGLCRTLARIRSTSLQRLMGDHLIYVCKTPSGRNVNYDDKQLSGKKIEFFLLSVVFVNTCPTVFLS
jgi:hypothetical protein